MPKLRDQRAFNVAYYAANRQREIDRVRRRQKATIEFLRELREVPCADCGRRFASHQMDFDHRDPAEKEFQLTSAPAALKSRDQLLAEASKCDVVCANCHSLRTRVQHRRWLATRTSSTRDVTAVRRVRWRYHADVLDQLRAVPCADCGNRFAPCAMQFDHRQSEAKVMGVTRMIGRAGIDRILAEAAKCDIVCANCHRDRTYQRRLKVTA